MKRKIKKDLIFEIEDYLKTHHNKDERKYLVLNYVDLDVLDAYIEYVDGWKNKIAKALLSDVTATLVGHIGFMEVFAGIEFSEDYIMATKVRSKKEEVVFGTYITPYTV